MTNPIAEALDLLGTAVTFREEAQQRRYQEIVAELDGLGELAEEEDLSHKTKAELQAIADELGVDYASSDTKAQLIDAIAAAGGVTEEG